MPEKLLREPNFAALVTLVWLLVALALLLQYWPQTGETLLDTDDAMRLVELRAWLDGKGLLSGWFDLHSARVQPPLGYDPHWSRLVDAGLAGMWMAFQLFDASSAERLMRAWWPLLWLLPTIGAMTAITFRIAGREGAMVSLLLALLAVPAYQQFTPGRIDHHNVQIALTLLVVAATVWSDRKRWAAAAAGGLSGLALTIGFECAPYVAVCGGMFALRHVFERDAGRPMREYGLALAASMMAGFLVSVPPSHWAVSQCDAIAVNSTAAVICAGLMLALVSLISHQVAATRAFAVFGAACLSAAVLVLVEPRCGRGPFAMVDPAIWPIWHDQVRELQPLFRLFTVNPLTASAIAAFPAAAVLAVLVVAQDRTARRDFGFLTAAATFLMAAATTIVAIRGFSYAIWLGMPLVAASVLRLYGAFKMERLVPRIATALLLTPLAVSSGAITIAYANGLEDTDGFGRLASRPCLLTKNYAPLAELQAGLVVTDISYGPFLLALTPHSVMTAPYHRLGPGIVTAHRALAAPPDEARSVLRQIRADYVMVCGPRPPDGLPEPARSASLWGRLQAGVVPAWLERLPVDGPFAVYRVRS